jgi:hypothetical protein
MFILYDLYAYGHEGSYVFRNPAELPPEARQSISCARILKGSNVANGCKLLIQLETSK